MFGTVTLFSRWNLKFLTPEIDNDQKIIHDDYSKNYKSYYNDGGDIEGVDNI